MEGRKLGLDIIYEEFGCIVHNVAKIMAENTPLKIAQMESISTRMFGYSVEITRECLFILLYHSLAQIVLEKANDRHPKYKLDFSAILYRIRFGYMLSFIEKIEGIDSSNIIHLIITNGRILTEQVNELKLFEKLRSKKYIINILKLSDTKEDEKPIEVAPQHVRKRRKKNSDKSTMETSPKSSTRNQISSLYNTLEAGQFFIVNYQQIFVEIKREMCLKYLNERFKDQNVSIFKYFFENQYESDCKASRSPFIKLETLEYLLQKNKIQLSLGLNMYLDYYCHLKCPVLKKDESSDQYSIDYQSIFTDLQLNVIVNILNAIIGKNSGRIFRIIYNNGILDEKTICDFALIQPKETRSILYKLLSNNFIRVQEIPRRSDRLPNNCLFLYYIDYASVVDKCISIAYKMILNLRRKHRFVGNKYSEVLNTVNVDKFQLKQFTEKMNLLILYIVNLDEMVSILRDFIVITR